MRISAGDLTAETRLRAPASSRTRPQDPCPVGKRFHRKKKTKKHSDTVSQKKKEKKNWQNPFIFPFTSSLP